MNLRESIELTQARIAHEREGLSQVARLTPPEALQAGQAAAEAGFRVHLRAGVPLTTLAVAVALVVPNRALGAGLVLLVGLGAWYAALGASGKARQAKAAEILAARPNGSRRA